MIHPLVRLIATQPHLVAEHLGGYFELIGTEAQRAKMQLMLQLLWTGLALACVGVAAVLAGVALMLWAITPDLSTRAAWTLAAAPGIPALVAVIAGLLARRPAAEKAFASIQKQMASDMRMLDEVSSL
jgi:uncharacterized membrane protein YqjE